ncbi:DUF2178 domain-containing protein [Candidatus Nanohalococcus occultus]|uniref:DUF2178 domain-containing protein n=1 Tax=Candidatus Nanohalococcus occultus TaxID=2978047 RepID=UPI0039E0DB51
MSDFPEVMRLATMLFVLPIWLIVTGLFVVEGMYVYALASVLFGLMMAYGAYQNIDSLRREDNIDDERAVEINRKAASSAFWTLFNIGLIWSLVSGFYAESISGLGTLRTYDAYVAIPAALITYLCFRVYYRVYGLEADFWKLKL